jgi:hypothetical protein
MITRGAIFTMRQWSAADGSAAHPADVLGVDVDRRLCQRRDAPGALVSLVDRRYALTGPVVAVGPALQMQRFLRRRAQDARLDAERAWLERACHALVADVRHRHRPPLASV